MRCLDWNERGLYQRPNCISFAIIIIATRDIMQTIAPQIATHLRQVFFGGNWTGVHLRETLQDVTWQEASQIPTTGNSIVALTYHIYYFVSAILPVMDGLPLDAHDRFSFDHPPFQSDAEWQTFLDRIWKDVELLSQKIENCNDASLFDDFVDEKYGTYYRNFHGLIEHTHYHLAQINALKRQWREMLSENR
jgi:hypothetical protein